MVAAMLHSLACHCAKADSHAFPGGSDTYVAGHTAGQGQTPSRFSYLPLPTIGHEHADGMIRRLLIAEPFGGDEAHAHWAQHRLRNQNLQDVDGNGRGTLSDLWRPRSRTMIERYVAGSRTWSTVTPIICLATMTVIPRRRRRAFCSRLSGRRACPPTPLRTFTSRKAPYWPGSRHPRAYRRPDYLRHLPAWHAWIRFRKILARALWIGAGRHCGLGLLAASDSP